MLKRFADLRPASYRNTPPFGFKLAGGRGIYFSEYADLCTGYSRQNGAYKARTMRTHVLIIGLLLATTASAEWTVAVENDVLMLYADRSTIRRNGNLVKMWSLSDFKTVQTSAYAIGNSYLSDKTHGEYDCKKEKFRILAFTWFDGQMGGGKGVYNTSETSLKWQPIPPETIGETMLKVACGKK